MNQRTIFAALWAIALIVEQLKWDEWRTSPIQFLLAVTAFCVLLRPGSVAGLILLAATQLASTIEWLPEVSNHRLFTGFISFAFLLLSTRLLTGGKAETEKVFADFASVCRISLILLYLFTAFHKLNSDFFDRTTSCAVVEYYKILDRLNERLELPWGEPLAIYGTMIIEFGVPLLLILRRTRFAGLILAILFHFALGISGYFNFSAMAYALLFLFVPQRIVERIKEQIVQRNLIRQFNTLFRPIVPWLIPILLLAATFVLLLSPWTPRPVMMSMFRDVTIRVPGVLSHAVLLTWCFFSLFGIALLIFAYRSGPVPWPRAREILLPRSWIGWTVPVLLLLNGFSAYLGLKTETSFSMYSNLSTESGKSNHFLIKADPGWFDYQHQLVQIVDSNDPELRSFIEKQYLVTHHTLRTFARRRVHAGQGKFWIAYKGVDNRLIEGPLEKQLDLLTPEPWWSRKLLHFRPVPQGTKRPCTH